MNVLTATKFLIHSIWDQPQYESDDRKIAECVNAIRDNADESDPVCSPDPIAFVYVFAIVLWALVPEDVVRAREGEIYEVMGELAEIVVEGDELSWAHSHKQCVEYMCLCLHFSRLVDTKLRPKLEELVYTWNPEWRY